MREISAGHQTPEGHWQRCFKDDLLSLLMWYREDKSVYGFQLSYDLEDNARTLTWIEERGFSHARVDDGESSPLKNRSPILLPSGDFAGAEVLPHFDAAAGDLPAAERAFIRQKLTEAMAWWRSKVASTQ